MYLLYILAFISIIFVIPKPEYNNEYPYENTVIEFTRTHQVAVEYVRRNNCSLAAGDYSVENGKTVISSNIIRNNYYTKTNAANASNFRKTALKSFSVTFTDGIDTYVGTIFERKINMTMGNFTYFMRESFKKNNFGKNMDMSSVYLYKNNTITSGTGAIVTIPGYMEIWADSLGLTDAVILINQC